MSILQEILTFFDKNYFYVEILGINLAPMANRIMLASKGERDSWELKIFDGENRAKLNFVTMKKSGRYLRNSLRLSPIFQPVKSRISGVCVERNLPIGFELFRMIVE